MHNPTHPTAEFDTSHQLDTEQGTVCVESSATFWEGATVDDLFVDCVTLEMPGLNPTPLFLREARALAAAPTAAATAGTALLDTHTREMAAERRSAREEVAR
ncbi:hypothetical protein [Leucobacter massiliensis]|uniref:Uncharacterized protein n=1 Tax=Leucobacter massiliensis TaxID=1686285 RepID=A0A2S9QNA2_9MICO|nr:hypothetical protein [Leucobacter massiliensis]PRI11074.1 hypothetical protein B4915_09435 [Leucobacter massiliensis]